MTTQISPPTNGAAELRPETEHPHQEGVPADLRLEKLRTQYRLIAVEEEILSKSEEIIQQTLAPKYFRLGKSLIMELAFKPEGMTDRKYFEQMGFSWSRCQNAMTIAEGYATAEEVKGMAVAEAVKVAREKRREEKEKKKADKKKDGFATVTPNPNPQDETGDTLVGQKTKKKNGAAKKKGGFGTVTPLDENGDPIPPSPTGAKPKPGPEDDLFAEPDERTDNEKQRDWLKAMRTDWDSLTAEMSPFYNWEEIHGWVDELKQKIGDNNNDKTPKDWGEKI